MVVLEVVLLVCGIVCVAVGFLPSEDKETLKSEVQENVSLSERQKDEIRRQVNELVSEELNAINERTEASLDKISNTKILEMNDYADTVMGEINKTHNEAVFLYDMLNEKAKEVKNTVKDVNIAKHEVKKMQSDITSEIKQGSESQVFEQKEQQTVRDIAKERLSELVKMSSEKARISEEQGRTQNQAGRLKSIVNGEQEEDEVSKNPKESSTESIIYLYRKGMSVREIAKQLGIGVGEVSLIIGLHDKEKYNEDNYEV